MNIKAIIISTLLCITLSFTLIAANSQCTLEEEPVAKRFLRTCYELEDYASIPKAIAHKDFLESAMESIQNESEELGIVGTFDDEEAHDFLSERFSSLCSDEIIEKMYADRILLDYYRALGCGKWNARVQEIVLTEMTTPNPEASRKLYGYDLSVLVKCSSTGEAIESMLSGRIATDVVDDAELVVYMNYGATMFPEYPSQ